MRHRLGSIFSWINSGRDSAVALGSMGVELIHVLSRLASVGSQMARRIAEQALRSARVISLGRLNKSILNRARQQTMLIRETLTKSSHGRIPRGRPPLICGQWNQSLWSSMVKPTFQRRRSRWPMAARLRWDRMAASYWATIPPKSAGGIR